MLRIADCLRVDHNYGLVLLAGMLCLLGCAASLLVARRINSGSRAALWLLLLSVSFGATVWSTHFVAMLAFKMELPVSFDATLTALSLIAGTVIMGLGFALAALYRESVFRVSAGGVIVGVGVSSLHYVGMAGLLFPGEIRYASDLVITSVVLSSGLGVAANLAIFRAAWSHQQLAGTLLLSLMICCLHFTGMGAAELVITGVDLPSESLGVSRQALVIAVAFVSLLVLATGAAIAVLGQQVSERLAAEAERFRTLADGAFEGLIIHKNERLLDANLAGKKLLGLDDSFHGDSIAHWSLQTTASAYNDSEELDLRGSNGELFTAEISRRAIKLSDGSMGELVALRDITEQKKYQRSIAHLALHDPLTNLPNRRFFADLSEKTLANARQSLLPFALMIIDIDDFKSVNDVHGHSIGDDLICSAAKRMAAVLQQDDSIARLGGDEFAIIQASEQQPEKAIALAQLLVETLKTPARDVDVEVEVSISVGVAVFPADGTSIDGLMRNADTAMFHAKADGKTSVRFFEQSMDAALRARRKLESRLRQALAKKDICVHYQPLVSCNSRNVVCFEALARWTDDDLGVVTPDQFIPVAEAAGLICELGEQVLLQACKEASAWPESIGLAVNLSVAQFKNAGLIASIKSALAVSGLSGNRLELEVTESLLMENTGEALPILKQLKSHGIKIAMDDFGTGYSSLGYLKSFDFDKLKIDRSFVSNLEQGTDSNSIVEAVIMMGKSLKMRIVAEGVETEAQAQLLTELGCNDLQGYLISKPLPANAIDEFLKSSAAAVGFPNNYLKRA